MCVIKMKLGAYKTKYDVNYGRVHEKEEHTEKVQCGAGKQDIGKTGEQKSKRKKIKCLLKLNMTNEKKNNQRKKSNKFCVPLQINFLVWSHNSIKIIVPIENG